MTDFRFLFLLGLLLCLACFTQFRESVNFFYRWVTSRVGEMLILFRKDPSFGRTKVLLFFGTNGLQLVQLLLRGVTDRIGPMVFKVGISRTSLFGEKKRREMGGIQIRTAASPRCTVLHLLGYSSTSCLHPRQENGEQPTRDRTSKVRYGYRLGASSWCLSAKSIKEGVMMDVRMRSNS